MVEIEKNPNTKEAKEYYQKLSEIQKNNVSRRKPASVIIKNVRGGRTLSTTEIEQNEDGTPVSNEEIVYRKKFIDFAATTFPEVNPIDYNLPDLHGKGQVRIQNYRYPCPPSVSRKGIVQWIHGFNDYSGRYAYLAK